MDRPSRRSVPLGAALCDRLCFPSSSALRERLAADDDRRRSSGGTGLLSMAAASLETGAGAHLRAESGIHGEVIVAVPGEA